MCFQYSRIYSCFYYPLVIQDQLEALDVLKSESSFAQAEVGFVSLCNVLYMLRVCTSHMEPVNNVHPILCYIIALLQTVAFFTTVIPWQCTTHSVQICQKSICCTKGMSYEDKF